MRTPTTRSLLALLAALTLLAATCGGDDGTASGEGGEAGDDPIVIGGIFDLTGATGDVGTPYSEGARDYVAYRNANGGVDGRQLDLVWQDYQYDVAIGEQLYSQHIGEGAVAILGWGTADTEALRGRIAQDEVPYFSGSLSEELVDAEESPYNFIPAATYSDQMRIALDVIAEEDPGAAVAVFHNDSPFGLSPVGDGEAYVEEAGLDLAGYRSYAMPGGATDYSSELRQAVNQGAEWVVIQNVASPAAQLIRNIEEQGLDLQVVCLNWCTSEITIELGGDAVDGVWGIAPYVPPTGEAEGLDVPREWLEEQGGDSLEDKGVHYVQGWYKTHVLVSAIEEVVDAGDEVTGANIKAALESGAFDTGGVTPDVEFSAESHRGVDGAAVYRIEDGAWTEVEAIREPTRTGSEA
jgi:branched-chain amino acid transport system substrate-binding protein